MAPGDYASVGSGKLKLKGVKDGKVDKKKKKSKSKSNLDPSASASASASAPALPGDDFQDRSVMLKNLHDEDEKVAAAEDGRRRRRKLEREGGEDDDDGDDGEDGEDGKEFVSRRDQDDREDREQETEPVKTEAERRYEEQRRRRVCLPSLFKPIPCSLCFQRVHKVHELYCQC